MARYEGGGTGERALIFALGAVGGAALGWLLSGSGAAPQAAAAAARLGRRARGAVRQRVTFDAGHVRSAALEQLEDDVLDALRAHPVLSGRPLEVACPGRGIIELSGQVRTADEAEQAVRLARTVQGVATVVNRMEAEDDGRRQRRPGDHAAAEGRMAGEWTGHGVGMGKRRQGDQEERGRTDDAQHIREMALEQSDRDQFEDEDLAHSQPVMSARPGPGDAAERTRYAEDELDNQDPYGKHAVPVPEQPQAMHSQTRVGEGLKPGTELALEQSDVPVKPHSEHWHGTDRGERAE